jgi:FixJ family two-component response regulator
MGPSRVSGVLIVDDEEDEIIAIRRMLESDDKWTAFFVATNYEEAIDIFENHPDEVTVALLDVALPGKNGVELAKRLLALKPSLRVLFISGHVGVSVIQSYGLNALEEHFLKKPFSRSMLLRRVRETVESDLPLRYVLSASAIPNSEP